MSSGTPNLHVRFPLMPLRFFPDTCSCMGGIECRLLTWSLPGRSKAHSDTSLNRASYVELAQVTHSWLRALQLRHYLPDAMMSLIDIRIAGSSVQNFNQRCTVLTRWIISIRLAGGDELTTWTRDIAWQCSSRSAYVVSEPWQCMRSGENLKSKTRGRVFSTTSVYLAQFYIFTITCTLLRHSTCLVQPSTTMLDTFS